MTDIKIPDSLAAERERDYCEKAVITELGESSPWRRLATWLMRERAAACAPLLARIEDLEAKNARLLGMAEGKHGELLNLSLGLKVRIAELERDAALLIQERDDLRQRCNRYVSTELQKKAAEQAEHESRLRAMRDLVADGEPITEEDRAAVLAELGEVVKEKGE